MANQHIARVPLDATNVFRSAGYDPSCQTLALEWNNGTVEHFTGVTQDVFDGFMAAPSKGQHYHQHLKGRFSQQKVDAPPLAECPACGDKGVRGQTCTDCGCYAYGDTELPF